DAVGTTAGLGAGIPCRRAAVETEMDEVLSHRFGRAEPDARRGSGRSQSPVPGAEETASAQAALPPVQGLDGAAILERTNAAECRGGSGGDRGGVEVFNIETGTANYFANGLLVHNCHNMGNADDTQGARGVVKASQQALAAMKLQKAVPKAKVVYVS